MAPRPSEQRPACEECHKVFPTCDALAAHKLEMMDSGKGHNHCVECGRMFSNPDTVLLHQFQVRAAAFPYRITTIIYMLGELSSNCLSKQYHAKPQDLQCPGCGLSFVRVGGLISHIESGQCRRISKEALDASRIQKLQMGKGLEDAGDPNHPNKGYYAQYIVKNLPPAHAKPPVPYKLPVLDNSPVLAKSPVPDKPPVPAKEDPVPGKKVALPKPLDISNKDDFPTLADAVAAFKEADKRRAAKALKGAQDKQSKEPEASDKSSVTDDVQSKKQGEALIDIGSVKEPSTVSGPSHEPAKSGGTVKKRKPMLSDGLRQIRFTRTGVYLEKLNSDDSVEEAHSEVGVENSSSGGVTKTPKDGDVVTIGKESCYEAADGSDSAGVPKPDNVSANAVADLPAQIQNTGSEEYVPPHLRGKKGKQPIYPSGEQQARDDNSIGQSSSHSRNASGANQMGSSDGGLPKTAAAQNTGSPKKADPHGGASTWIGESWDAPHNPQVKWDNGELLNGGVGESLDITDPRHRDFNLAHHYREWSKKFHCPKADCK